MKYTEYEDWMEGRKVVEDDTGDVGVVLGPVGPARSDYHLGQGLRVKWTTGLSSGSILAIGLNSVSFPMTDEVGIREKLDAVQRLLNEIKRDIAEKLS